MNFFINFDTLSNLLLPPTKRKTKIKAFLKCLLKPIKTYYSDFLNFRQDQINKVSHTGQVISMEHILNQKFNNGAPGIFITDGNWKDPQYLFHPAENKRKTYLYHSSEIHYKTFLFHESEFAALYDFIVNVPSAIYNNSQIRSVIDYYKPAGLHYNIVTY